MSHICHRCHTPVRTGPFTDQDTNTVEVLTVEDVTLPGSQVPRTRVHECRGGDDTAPPADDFIPCPECCRSVRRWVVDHAGASSGQYLPADPEHPVVATLIENQAMGACSTCGSVPAPATGPRAGDTAPDDGQCRYCPNDVDRGEDGYLHCVECGWTDNPATVVHFRDEVDELRDAADAMRAAGDEVVEVVAYIVDRLGPGVCPASVAGAVERGIQVTQRWRSAAGSPTTDGKAPADESAAAGPEGAPRANWSGAWAELTGYVRAASSPIDPDRLDVYLTELKRKALRPVREWMENVMAGQPVRDSQDGSDRA